MDNFAECDVTNSSHHLAHYRAEVHKEDDGNIYDLCSDHLIDAITEWVEEKSEQWDEIRIMSRREYMNPE